MSRNDSVRFWSVMQQQWKTVAVIDLTDEDLATSFTSEERPAVIARRTAARKEDREAQALARAAFLADAD